MHPLNIHLQFNAYVFVCCNSFPLSLFETDSLVLLLGDGREKTFDPFVISSQKLIFSRITPKPFATFLFLPEEKRIFVSTSPLVVVSVSYNFLRSTEERWQQTSFTYKIRKKFCDYKDRALSAVKRTHSRHASCFRPTDFMKRYVPELHIMDVFVFLLLTGVAYAVIKMGLELDKQWTRDSYTVVSMDVKSVSNRLRCNKHLGHKTQCFCCLSWNSFVCILFDRSDRERLWKLKWQVTWTERNRSLNWHKSENPTWFPGSLFFPSL